MLRPMTVPPSPSVPPQASAGGEVRPPSSRGVSFALGRAPAASSSSSPSPAHHGSASTQQRMTIHGRGGSPKPKANKAKASFV